MPHALLRPPGPIPPGPIPLGSDRRPVEVPARCGRAVVSAVAALALGAVGHALGGGTVGAGGVLLGFLLVVAPSWMLTGRERGWAVIAGVQVAAQQVLHPVLTATGDGTVGHLVPHDVMLYLHLLGALVMAVWLRGGERRVWAAAVRVAARIVRWCVAPHPLSGTRSGTLVPVGPARAGFGPPPLRHAPMRRGPPHSR